jgi:hypothetical protein
VAGLITGVLLHQPARRAPWLLLAAGSLCALAGQVLALATAGPAGRPLDTAQAAEMTAAGRSLLPRLTA